jgi:hypothetical protein
MTREVGHSHTGLQTPLGSVKSWSLGQKQSVAVHKKCGHGQWHERWPPVQYKQRTSLGHKSAGWSGCTVLQR